jgi:hypothetical protein
MSETAYRLMLAREAALTAAWEAFLSDVPMSWVRA